MKLYVSGILFSLLFSVAAKPGESYVLTGREKSIFEIFQADLKAYRHLYEGEDINTYYRAFKSINNLGERKLKPGEELIFPDTEMSKKIREAEIAKAAKAAEDATAPKEPAPEPDAQSPATTGSPEAERARAEAQQKKARHEAIHYYQHTLLPHWMFDYKRNMAANIEKGNINALVDQAHRRVDEHFAKSIVLHASQDKKIYVLEFEKPEYRGQYFFFAIKKEESGRLYLYSLEQGISLFGVGDASVLFEWRSGEDFSDLGGRDYNDLSSFLQELEAGRPEPSDDEA